MNDFIVQIKLRTRHRFIDESTELNSYRHVTCLVCQMVTPTDETTPSRIEKSLLRKALVLALVYPPLVSFAGVTSTERIDSAWRLARDARRKILKSLKTRTCTGPARSTRELYTREAINICFPTSRFDSSHSIHRSAAIAALTNTREPCASVRIS